MENQKVLIVDDTDHLRLYVKKCLERAGFNVVEAENGLEALRALQMNDDIKLVFLDMMMPKMSGLEFLSKVKNLKKELNIHICAMTALEGVEGIKKCLSSGADDYIVKPVDESILIDKAKILLSSKDVNEFYSLKMEIKGSIDTFDDKIEINIKNMSESSLMFTSGVQLPIGARVSVRSQKIQEILCTDQPFLLRLYSVEKRGNEFINIGTFIALKDSEYKLIRSVTTRGG